MELMSLSEMLAVVDALKLRGVRSVRMTATSIALDLGTPFAEETRVDTAQNDDDAVDAVIISEESEPIRSIYDDVFPQGKPSFTRPVK